MTPKKTRFTVGRRPSKDECLEAWWRVADSPAGKLLPDRPRGKPSDRMKLCNPFDLYCWRLVGEAFVKCKTRGIPATKLARLVAHRQCGGKFSDFQVYDLIQLDPSDPNGWKSVTRPVTEVDRIGVDDAWIARAAYAKFLRVLQSVIDGAEPYIQPGHVDMA